jgi:sugar phosphate isomerase/epimerase
MPSRPNGGFGTGAANSQFTIHNFSRGSPAAVGLCYVPAMSLPNPVSRRTFLALAGALPFALRASAAQSKIPVGLELYSVRDALAKDLPGTVTAVAKMGYEVVEFYSPYFSWTPQAAKDVRKLMDDLGIRCLSTHNSPAAIAPEGIQKAIDLNQILGSRDIIVASAGKTAGIDGWKAFGASLNAAAERLKPAGMFTGFHNHATEWRPIEGQRPMDVLAASTMKEVILQLDVGTCVEAGADPVAWIKANPGRTKSVHCKDWAPGRGYGVLFGEGAAPWPAIFQAAESTGGVQHYLIEQEEGPAAEQMQRAERCLANWKKLKGKT